MLFSSGRKAVHFDIGDKVIIIGKSSNASLNLYQKTKQAGLSYVHCLCHSHPNCAYEVVSSFSSGYLIKAEDRDYIMVAHPNDMRRV